MKKILLALAVAVSLCPSNPLKAGSPYAGSLDALAQKAVSTNPKVSAAAIAALRAEGPTGLQALTRVHARTILQHESNLSPAIATDDWQRLQAALDAVSGQRDCQASRLYWYTDFEQAKAAAKAQSKPILSLRLLGRLDEEYSCANSRFFRTTLYANTEVSQYLREHFILHWKSLRPVPRIFIDFGDGRRIERTITGNSIHYVLDSEGTPIDAVPGLYGPKAFLKVLSQAERATANYMALIGTSRADYLKQYHNELYVTLISEWDADLVRIGNNGLSASANYQVPSSSLKPTALAAGLVAVTKSGVELPVLKSFQKRGEAGSLPSSAGLSDSDWLKIAALHTDEARLDFGAQRLLHSKNPTAQEASFATASKAIVENPFMTALHNLQRSIAEDTVRNEYLLHSQIHQWFIKGIAPANLDQLNSKVYAELFLTPDSDPWLGLAPANTLTGLDNNGLVQTSPRH